MKYGYAALLAIASTVACVAPTASSESADETTQELSTAGVTATITITSPPSGTNKNYTATVTVANKSANPQSNWQVALNMNQSTLTAGSTSPAEVATINGITVFSPSGNASLAAGASTSFTFRGVQTGTSYTPTVITVDGDTNGTTGTNWPSDGIDHIARAAATGAVNVAIAYENNKVANNGDANYAQYDNFLWSAQQYIISGSRIAFDPNMPGYAFVPTAAMNALDTMQDNSEVAAYLTAGLQSCFADTKATYIYAFRAQVLKGYQNSKTTSGTMIGVIPAAGAFTPTGYNVNNVVDNFTTVGMQTGGSTINVTETSSTAKPDYWFGLLTYMTLSSFSNTTAVAAKFGTGGQSAGCSPFNGPGGSANPYFAITLNGQTVAPRFTGVGAQCLNACTSSFVADPAAYATPGPYFNAAGLVGPQSNPYAYDPSYTQATIDHVAQFATQVSGSTTVFGTFNSAVSKRGAISGYGWLQCGTAGSGC